MRFCSTQDLRPASREGQTDSRGAREGGARLQGEGGRAQAQAERHGEGHGRGAQDLALAPSQGSHHSGKSHRSESVQQHAGHIGHEAILIDTYWVVVCDGSVTQQNAGHDTQKEEWRCEC